MRKDRRQEEKGTTEDKMVGWHHQLNGHEFGHTLGDSLKAGKPGVLQSERTQRIRRDLVTEQHLPLSDETGCHGLFF